MNEHHLILRVITRILFMPILLFGLYVQFHGDFGPGGGFQAGVIFAVGFILYGIVFSLARLKRAIKPNVVYGIAATGALLYIAVGILSIILDHNFLDYSPMGQSPKLAQHYGIVIVEFAVGMTVFATMLAVYYAFAGRPPKLDDKDW